MSTFSAYLVTPAEGPREWLTVGGDAGKLARETAGRSEGRPVPSTKAGLIPFLNDLERFHYEARQGAQEAPPAVDAASEPEAPRIAQAPPPKPLTFARPAAPPPGDADALVDWLFDHATPSQVHDVFNAISCRFAETIKLERAAA